MNYDIENPEKDVFEDGFEDPDMQDFYDNVAKRFCPECGKAYKRNPIGRPKLFCSEECRRAWHSKQRPSGKLEIDKETYLSCLREDLSCGKGR